MVFHVLPVGLRVRGSFGSSIGLKGLGSRDQVKSWASQLMTRRLQVPKHKADTPLKKTPPLPKTHISLYGMIGLAITISAIN